MCCTPSSTAQRNWGPHLEAALAIGRVGPDGAGRWRRCADDLLAGADGRLVAGGALAEEAGIRHVHLFAWRDLDDAEAGGSERHANRVASLWAEAGLDVLMRTSTAQGHRHYPRVHREGYDVVRRSGRYFVFPHVIASESLQRYGRADAVVDIWNVTGRGVRV